MSFLPSTGFGATEGADMLQSILKQKAEEAFRAQQIQQEQQRIALESQRAQQQAAYQAEALKSLQEERAAKQQADAQQSAIRMTGLVPRNTPIDPTDPGVQVMQKGGLGSLLSQDQTLASAPLKIVGGQVAGVGDVQPGKATGAVRFMGTPAQNEQDARDAARARFLASNPKLGDAIGMLDPDKAASVITEYLKEQAKAGQAPQTENVYRIGQNGKMELVGTVPKGSNVGNAPTPPQAPLMLVKTVDDNGNAVQQFVKKEPGKTYATPTSATVQNRVESAKAVQQTGNDIIAELKDPAFAGTLGPALGRYSSLQDFIGNPPPEFSKLAGQIESYSLANMGVHGMRSAQGAQMIQHLLSGKHTPESLTAAIQGLNGFSQHFIENTGQGGKGGALKQAPSTGAGGESAEHRVWRLTGMSGPEPK